MQGEESDEKWRGTPFYFAPLPTVWTPGTGYWEMSAEIPYWWCVTYPDLGSASYWSCCGGNLLQPIRALPRSQLWHVISIKFLSFFLRGHFVGKPAVALWIVGCFSGYSYRQKYKVSTCRLPMMSKISGKLRILEVEKNLMNGEKVYIVFVWKYNIIFTVAKDKL